MSEPIEYGTYSPEDDKLRIYSGQVSEELYARLKKLGFGRAYKQGCFYAAWTPEREDVVLELCDGKIDNEDSTLADRAEDRAERFASYSTNAGKRATAAARASDEAVEGIPPGQPILIGHHSEKHHRAAIAKAQRNATKSVEEFHKSRWWAERAENVLSHAGRKHQPGAISRRIKKFEAKVRMHERRIDPKGADWAQDLDWLRGFEEKGEVEISAIWQRRKVRNIRWIVHLRGQIAFWQVILADAGGVPADEWADEFEVGGWVRGQYGWGQIERINKAGGRINSVSLDRATFTVPYMIRIIKYERIREYQTDEKYQKAEEIK